MPKIFFERPGKGPVLTASLDDEYTIAVTRPDGCACVNDEARTRRAMCLREGSRKRRKTKVLAQQRLETRGQMRLVE
ncbi:hypothetical protein [Paraburkholderia sp. 40]|uniref:hypothetical protein n=1 Tax=Paraburkholderia sp. 40 TaxID=2991059 RepID=UPI003D19D8E3